LSFLALVLLLCIRWSVTRSIKRDDLQVQSCCEHLQGIRSEQLPDIRALLRCVNSSVARSFAGAKYAVEGVGPSLLKLAILTRATPSVYNYASYSFLIQSVYAALHGYTMLPLVDDSSRPDYVYHRKLSSVLQIMEDEAFHIDYVVWMDADLIPLDLELRLEHIAASVPGAHVVLSEDVSSSANTGCLLVRNSLWTRRFLRDWIAQKDLPGVANEQLGFECLYRTLDPVAREKIAILPAHVLNSIASPIGEQMPTHKILHLAAEGGSMRAAVFRAAATEVCAAISEDRAPLSQLGVSRAVLQETAAKMYALDVHRLEASLALRPELVSDVELTEYRTSVSKLCYAQKCIAGYKETEVTAGARRRAVVLTAHLIHGRLRSIFDESRRRCGILGSCAVSEIETLEEHLTPLPRPDDPIWADAVAQSVLQLGRRREQVIALLRHYPDTFRAYLQYCQTQDPLPPALDSCNATSFRGQYQQWLDLPDQLKIWAELGYEVVLLASEGTSEGDGHYLGVESMEQFGEMVSFAVEVLLQIVDAGQLDMLRQMKSELHSTRARQALSRAASTSVFPT